MGKLPLHERAFAESAALLSRACVAMPSLGRWVVGDELRVTPMGFHAATAPRQDVQEWPLFPGDPDAGRLPRGYQHVGTIMLRSKPIKEVLNKHPDAIPAVVWALKAPPDADDEGEGFNNPGAEPTDDIAVMYGLVPNHQRDQWLRDALVGLRIGRKPLRMAAGLALSRRALKSLRRGKNQAPGETETLQKPSRLIVPDEGFAVDMEYKNLADVDLRVPIY